MARIRTIKPEYWDSPGIETLDARWRLLYIAMWNWADDNGRGKAEARELMGFVFPRDEDMTLAEFRRGLGEVRRVFGVKFYKVNGRSFYAIPTWEKHQKIDRRSAARCPAPEDGAEYNPADGKPVNTGLKAAPPESRRDPIEPTPLFQREVGAGTEEQRNRGTTTLATPDKPARKPRQRDDLWDAIVEGCGIDSESITKASSGPIATARKQLAEVGATPAQVKLRCRRYRTTYPTLTLTPTALVKHWPQLSESVNNPTPAPQPNAATLLSRGGSQ